VLLRAVVLTVLAAGAISTATDQRAYTIPLPPGRALSVELTVGHLRVRGESRSDALIEVVRTAPNPEALSRIPVTLEESAIEVRVVGVQTAHQTDAALKTDVSIRVPHDAALNALRVMEGRITLEGLSGSVNADLRRGPIDARNLAGVVRLETGIGDLSATAMRLTPQGLIRLRAFNGNVRLTLAEQPKDARVMALALNGTIQSEIPLTMRDTWGPRWGEAVLGKGEPVISLDVVTGRIEITTSR
jgi:hypothetical protein